MSTELFLGIIAAAVIILFAFLIYLILHIKKTLDLVENSIKITQESLTPLLTELTDGVKRINMITEDIEASTSNLQHVSKALGDIGTMVEDVNSLIKKTGLTFSIKTASLGVGIKTALTVLAKGMLKKGGITDE